MPKRKSDETEEERLQRKMKKYESKLHAMRSRQANRIIYSSEEERAEHDRIGDYLESMPASPAELDEYSVDVHNDEIATVGDNEIEGSAEDQSAAVPALSSTPAPVTSVTDTVTTANTPSTSADATVTPGDAVSTPADIDAFDPELLQALGEFEADTVEWGENIHHDIAKQYQHVLLNGLKKEVKEELNKTYLFPKNVPYAKAPTLNPEIAAMLTESCRNRDKRILAKQEQIGKALSALGKAITNLLKKESNIPEAIRTLNDVGKLIADAHFAETDTRRSVVIPLVDKSLIDPFKDRKRDGFLFGEKLGDLVKSSRGINKTGQMIQAPSTSAASSSTLNWRAPSSRPRPPRGGQSYHSRGGAQRASYQNRRRAPTAPAPPARRQAPPPPPPPARRQPAQAPRPSTQRPM